MTQPTLHQLITYYQDCLRHEADVGMRLFMDEEDQQWTTLPLDQEWNLSAFDKLSATEVCKLLLPHQSDSVQASTLTYGYPLLVQTVEIEGKQIQHLVPLLLQDVVLGGCPGQQTMALSPIIRLNKAFLSECDEHKSELTRLHRQAETPRELVGAIQTLLAKQEVIPLVEFIDTNLPSFDFMPEQGDGLYNRAVLSLPGKLPYVAGLENELDALLKGKVGIQGTALAALIKGTFPSNQAAKNKPLLEIVPLNHEQRQSVVSASQQPLTIVTGPPGTGKSQVVHSVLANAFVNQERVLLAAKNHKAINVIEERFNQEQDFNLLLRAGRQSGERNLKQELIETLDRLLTKPHKQAAFSHDFIQSRRQYQHTQRQVNRLQEQIQSKKERQLTLDHAKQLLLDEQRLDETHGTAQEWAQHLETWRTLSKRLLHRTPLRTWQLISLWQQTRERRALLKACDQWGLTDEVLSAHPSYVSFSNQEPWKIWVRMMIRVIEHRWAIAVINNKDYSQEALTTDQDYQQLESLVQQLATLGANSFKHLVKTWASSLTGPTRIHLGGFLATLQRLANDKTPSQSRSKLVGALDTAFMELVEVLPLWSCVNLSAHQGLPLTPGLFDLLIIDEASQSDIVSALPLFLRAKRVMIVGDGQQLRHVSTLSKSLDHQLQRVHGLDTVSGQRWSYRTQSLFDVARSHPSAHVVQLVEHYRCHEEIIGFANQHWYGGSLQIKTDPARLHPSLPEKGLHWVKVSTTLYPSPQGGVMSPDELDAVIQVCQQLEQSNFDGSVGIVTPFRAQVASLQQAVTEHLSLAWRNQVDLIVNSAHGYQGDEKDVMIFSLCVGNPLPWGSRQFLEQTHNLFNVALSRARGLMYIVGDPQACETSGIDYLMDFHQYCEDLHQRKQDRFPLQQSEVAIGHWEKVLWNALKREGLEPLVQFPVGPYRLDLAYVTMQKRLAIEIDGEEDHQDAQGHVVRSDRERDAYLVASGWHIHRVPVSRLRENLKTCVAEIKNRLNLPFKSLEKMG